MVNIHCFKTFQSFYKIEAKLNDINNINNTTWTAHKFKADNCNCVTFIHHQTLFNITLFDFKKADFKNLKELFNQGIQEHLERFLTLKENDLKSIKKYSNSLSFSSKTNDNEINKLLSNIIFVIKHLNIWDFENENQASIKESYDETELLCSKTECENFLNSIK